MRKRKAANKWAGNLRRSLALALVLSGGAYVCLPSMASATESIYTNDSNKSVVESSDNDATSTAITGNTLTLPGEGYTNAIGGYSLAFSGGGDATSGNVTNNTLTVGYSTTNAYGGYSFAYVSSGTGTATSYNANGNTLTIIAGGSAEVEAYGGCSYAHSYTGNATSGEASSNTVYVQSGTNGPVYGGASKASADVNDNSPTVTSAAANGNKVYIFGGSVSGVYGGYSDASDCTTAKSGTASNNTVTISGSSTITGDVYGGYSDASSNTSATSDTASNNTVTISGNSTISGNVYGGFSVASGISSATSGDASNNVINIYDSPNLTAATLYGGYSLANVNNAPTFGKTENNTLNIYTSGLTVKNILNFANINFYLPSSVVSGDTILTLTSTDGTGLRGVSIKAGVMGGSSLAVGDTVTLLTNTHGISTDSTTSYGTLSAGVSLDYGLSVAKTGDNSITATITSVSSGLKAQTKSLVETSAGAAAFLNGGMSMMAGAGIVNAANAVHAATGSITESTESQAAVAPLAVNNTKSSAVAVKATDKPAAAQAARTMAPFAAMSGSAVREHTGSYVDVRGINLAVGFAKEVKNAQGTLLFGPMVEYGAGKYTSHLDDGTRGDGNTHYAGGGFFAKETQKNGFYYEGSLRAGRTTADYRSYDLSGVTGTSDGHVSYDSSANYWGAHLGLGKILTLANGNTLDFYGKYFHARTGSDDVTLSSGEQYHFDAVESDTVRIGGRYTHPVSSTASIYAGLAYQYEFNGDARAHYKGMSTASPSIKGGSGLLELGWQVKPSAHSPLTLDLGLTGWVGRQEGVTFQAGAQWKL